MLNRADPAGAIVGKWMDEADAQRKRAERAEQRAERLAEALADELAEWNPERRPTLSLALRLIAENAESWHAGEDGKARALAVIAKWARDPSSIPVALSDQPHGDYVPDAGLESKPCFARLPSARASARSGLPGSSPCGSFRSTP